MKSNTLAVIADSQVNALILSESALAREIAPLVRSCILAPFAQSSNSLATDSNHFKKVIL